MPVLQSKFSPPAFLRNGHLQTILPVLLPRRFAAPPPVQTLELADGDFLSLYPERRGHRRAVILCHGLEGSAENPYIRGMAAALHQAGWDTIAWNFRGCGPQPNRLLRFYHSGATEDLRAIIDHAATEYPTLALVGFSLGGNLILKLLGEAPPHSALVGGAAISAPVDLAASAHALDHHWPNRIYLRRFLKTLTAKIALKHQSYPSQLNLSGLNSIRSFAEFDNRFTAPLHGFRDALDYWQKSSSRQFLKNIRIPTLLLSARNDPFLAPSCFPWPEAEANPNFWLEAPESGGHVGFLQPNLSRWSEGRVVEFFAEHLRAG